ncbi:MAG: hypothetical protein JWN48_2797 [Myxococcaceae bacterium]|nr:hypothetical protein [Myxococcaceae bacterium]
MMTSSSMSSRARMRAWALMPLASCALFAGLLAQAPLARVAHAQQVPLAPQAQPPSPPTGPADIMNRANEGRASSEAKAATETADSVAAQAGAPAAVPPQPAPSAASPHSHGGVDPSKVLAEPTLPMAEPKQGLAPGTIEIEVVDQSGAPQPGAEIVLGVMASMGGRTEQRARTDAHGHYTFRGLNVGSQQAYRGNVLREGAKFSTTPFRLPEELGYHARVPVLGVTRDQRLMFQVIGQTVVELRDDRLHITQQARLANAGEQVITFPKEGLVVPLPQGFTAFTWQDQMSDQKGEELAGKGFRIRGSLPPGSATLAWTFDLQRDGAAAKIAINQPWRTYTYRVISEAPAGLKLRVSDFPEAELVHDNNRDLLFTQLQRAPNDAQLAGFTIRIDGIPGPGPGRWFAVALAALAVAIGISRAFKRSDDRVERKSELAARKRELIELAKQAERERERGDIGPNYHAEKLDEIVTELALVLRDEESLAAKAKPSGNAAPAVG